MSTNTPATEKLNPEQHDLFENAQRRIQQKKRSFNHLVLFLMGSVVLFITNKAFQYGPETDWYLWVVVPWSVLLIYHWVQVFIMDRFLGPQWERTQRDKLVQLQRRRIENLKSELEGETPLKTSEIPDTSK